MELTRVESSMIYAVGYDEDTQTLEIVFNSGGIYRYADVPPEEYEDLLNADSKGRYFLAHIRDVYEYWRVQ